MDKYDIFDVTYNSKYGFMVTVPIEALNPVHAGVLARQRYADFKSLKSVEKRSK